VVIRGRVGRPRPRSHACRNSHVLNTCWPWVGVCEGVCERQGQCWQHQRQAPMHACATAARAEEMLLAGHSHTHTQDAHTQAHTHVRGARTTRSSHPPSCCLRAAGLLGAAPVFGPAVPAFKPWGDTGHTPGTGTHLDSARASNTRTGSIRQGAQAGMRTGLEERPYGPLLGVLRLHLLLAPHLATRWGGGVCGKSSSKQTQHTGKRGLGSAEPAR